MSTMEQETDQSNASAHLEQTDRPSDPSILPRVVSGSIGSLVTALAVTPLEVTKIRQQAGILGASSPSIPSIVTPCPRGCGTLVLSNGLMETILPRSAMKCFDAEGRLTEQARLALTRSSNQQVGTFGTLRRIFANEGLGGIYAGLRPTLYMSVPNTVMYYTTYDEIVTKLRHHRSAHSVTEDWWVPLVSGSSARILATALTAPLELVRTRQSALVGASEKAPGMIEEFKIIIRDEGFGALYRGLGPTLWRDVPFSGIYWLCLENFKAMWKSRDGRGVKPTPLQTAWQSFVNGAAAGMIAAFATTPFDVVKTKRQTATELVAASSAQEIACDHHGAVAYKPSSSVSSRDAGTLATMRNIFETEGLSGLWRGNQTRMIKVAPACAIMITCYEVGKQIMS